MLVYRHSDCCPLFTDLGTEKSNCLSPTWTNTLSRRPERGQRRKWQDNEQRSLSPSRSIRWGNSRRQGHRDMSAQLRNGGCLTLFPAFPSPSPFPSNTLPNTDWAVCVASCYCCRSTEQFNSKLRVYSQQPFAPTVLCISNKVWLKSCTEEEGEV